MGSPMHKTAYWPNMRQLHADTRKFLMILKRNVKLLFVFLYTNFTRIIKIKPFIMLQSDTENQDNQQVENNPYC